MFLFYIISVKSQIYVIQGMSFHAKFRANKEYCSARYTFTARSKVINYWHIFLWSTRVTWPIGSETNKETCMVEILIVMKYDVKLFTPSSLYPESNFW